MSNTIVLPDWLEAANSLTFSEQGFNERADAIMALDGADLNEFWNEIQQTIQLRNQDRNRLLNAFTTPVTAPVVQFAVPSEVDFEEASEYGQPVGIRGGATRFWRGFDFKFYDLAIRYTWMFIAESDINQLRMLNSLALDADNKLIFQKVMKCLFNPINTLGVTDKNEPITAYKFYNADGEVPPAYKTNTFNSSHNHYVVSGGATLTSANITSLINELGHHGYTMGNNYQLVLWMNPAQVATIKAFRVATGAEYDFIPNTNLLGGGVFVPNNGTYVGAPQGQLPGEVGTYGPFHIVQEDYIPAGYVAALASGGSGNTPGALKNPIGFREHANPAYRGLKVIPGSMHTYPLLDSYYRRGFGTGITQRGGGVIMQVTTNGSYTVPAIYA